MSWDAVIVYAIGCLALEQSRDVPAGKRSRLLQRHGMACMQQGGWVLWDAWRGKAVASC